MKNNALKTVGLMMAITFIGKIMGLGRDMLFTYNFGASAASDAFNMASMIPRNFLDIIFASAISASFIPVFNEYMEKKGQADAYRLSNNFITLIVISSSFITLVAIIFAEPITAIFCRDFDAEGKALTISLLRVMLPLIVLSGIAFSLVGIVQSLGEFNIPAAMSIASNGLIILYYVFFVKIGGFYGLALAFLLGWALQVFIQAPFLLKNKFKYKFLIDLHDPGIKQIGKLMLPVMVSTWVQPVNILINASMVTFIIGGVTALNFANTLYSIITGVFILSVANIIFPKLSQINARNDKGAFGDTMHATLRGLIFFLIPMTTGLMILAEPIVRLAFERGAYAGTPTKLTSIAFFYYSTGIIGYGLQTILSRGFYSMQKGLLPLVTGIIAVLLNICIGFATIPRLGIGGPALASAVSLNVSALIMLIFMYKHYKNIINLKMLKDILLMAFASGLMGAGVYFSYAFMSARTIPVIALGGSIALGILIYMCTAKLLNINEAAIAFNLLQRKD